MPIECDGVVSPVTYADYPSIRTIESEEHSAPWSDEAIMVELRHEQAFHFGIRSSCRNTLTAYLLSRFFLDELHLHRICTHPHYRRRGFARTLLLHALDTARSRGAVRAFLEVDAGNIAAVHLYRRTGFAVDYERKNYYASGGNALVMSVTP